MKAEAIAAISLIKKSPYDIGGKGLETLLPYFTAYFLSLISPQTVLTRKTIANF